MLITRYVGKNIAHLLSLGYTADKLHHETVEEHQSIGLSWHLKFYKNGV